MQGMMERGLVGDAHAAMFRLFLMEKRKSRQQSGLLLMDSMTLSSQLSRQKMFHKHRLLLQRRANVVG